MSILTANPTFSHDCPLVYFVHPTAFTKSVSTKLVRNNFTLQRIWTRRTQSGPGRAGITIVEIIVLTNKFHSDDTITDKVESMAQMRAILNLKTGVWSLIFHWWILDDLSLETPRFCWLSLSCQNVRNSAALASSQILITCINILSNRVTIWKELYRTELALGCDF